ncbi:MAG: dihydroorotase family protein [Malacoplasma sp.]
MITLLKNCLLSDSRKVHIILNNEKIYKIIDVANENILANIEIDWVFDIKNNLVMPGIIDSFSKINPNSAYVKSNYLTESISSITGGITTFVDYETQIIGDSYLKVLSNKFSNANSESLSNFGFFVSASELTRTKEALKETSKIHDFTVGTMLNLNEANIKEYIDNYHAIPTSVNSSKLVCVHLSGSRIDDFFSVCKDKNIKLLFHDITNGNDLEKILSYKEMGFNIRTSTSINYLILNRDQISNEYKKKTLLLDYQLGNMMDNISLWNAVKDGKIDMITSNHTPITLIDKFENETPGLPGFETMFSILFDSFFYKKISVSILEKLLSKNPAVILGLKDKGKIEEGYDADIIVVNSTKRWLIKNEDIVSSARWSQFNDTRVMGRVIMTFVNGNLAYNYWNQMNPIRNVAKGKMISFNNDIFLKENMSHNYDLNSENIN